MIKTIKDKIYIFFTSRNRLFNRLLVAQRKSYYLKRLNRRDTMAFKIQAAIGWLRRNSSNDGIFVSNRLLVPYYEVSGYFLPTLKMWGEKKIALKIVKSLIKHQNADGSFNAPDGKPYTFDTAQVVRGLLFFADQPGVKTTIIKACDWIITQISPNGQMLTPHKEMWGGIADDRIHLYAIKPLQDAGKIFQRKKYLAKAKLSLCHYINRKDLLDFNTRLHFYMYILEGLNELGKKKLSKRGFRKLIGLMTTKGFVPAYPRKSWICSCGLAQFASLGFDLGYEKEASEIYRRLLLLQNPTGGFYGSYGLGAKFLKNEEVSWTIKFFLDATNKKIIKEFDHDAATFPKTVLQDDAQLKIITDSIGVDRHQRVLDAGCGNGRFLKRLRKKYSTLDLYGLDISSKMLKQVSTVAHIQVGTLLNLGYPDNFFDLVYSIEALEHSVRVEKAIEEMMRVLKPGGVCIIIDKNVENLGEFKIKEWEQWFDGAKVSKMLLGYCKEVKWEYFSVPDLNDKLFIYWKGVKNK